MYARLIMFVVGLCCFVVLATAFAQWLTDQEMARRGTETSQYP
jgi:hypothetical protein